MLSGLALAVLVAIIVVARLVQVGVRDMGTREAELALVREYFMAKGRPARLGQARLWRPREPPIWAATQAIEGR